MNIDNFQSQLIDSGRTLITTLLTTETLIQLAFIAAVVALAYLISGRLQKHIPILSASTDESSSPLRKLTGKLGNLIFPLFTIVALAIGMNLSAVLLGQSWLLRMALILVMLVMCGAVIRDFVKSEFIAFVFRWVGLPLLCLHLLGALTPLISILEAMSVTLGKIQISAYGVIRIILFG